MVQRSPTLWLFASKTGTGPTNSGPVLLYGLLKFDKIHWMKRLLFIFILLMVLFSYTFAQTQGISFEETTSWKKVVKKAKEEKKLIFVDCYADWCGPCKRLASAVFTQDKVGDFFNRHFVNVRLNVEKDEDGKTMAQRWQVSALPTLLFVDPETEQPVHRIVGFGDADWLIGGGGQALDPGKRLDTMLARYDQGERDTAFMIQLVKMLHAAGMKDELQKITKEFLGGLTLEQLATPVVWSLIVQYENDPLSRPLLTVRDNIEMFYAIPGQKQHEMVDAKLAGAMLGKAMEFAMNPNLAVYDQPAYNAFVDYLDKAEDPGKSMAAVWLNTSLLSRQGDWKQMLDVMKAVKDEAILPAQVYGQYFMFFMQSLGKMDDKKAVEGGVEWIDEIIAEASDENLTSCYVRSTMYGAKAGLYEAAGKYGPAQKARKEMEKYLKLIQEQGGQAQQ